MCWLVKNALLCLFFITCSCTQVAENQKKTIEKSDPLSLGKRFVDEADFRRTLLINSFVNPENEYSALRAQNYGPGKFWEELDIWNPDVRHLTDHNDSRSFESFPTLISTQLTRPNFGQLGKRRLNAFLWQSIYKFNPIFKLRN